MDSLTQIVLGAACGEAVLGKKIGNKALLFGAIGGTIPDLDVFIGPWLYSNEIQAMAFHRGFMHSIWFAIMGTFVFGYLAFKLYDTGKRKGTTALKDWRWLFFWALLTHPILDCFTPYGTQLFGPIWDYRIAFNNIAVADPMYTVPFLLCLIILMFFNRKNPKRKLWLKLGLGISSAYMLFTVGNKLYINSIFKSSLEASDIAYSRFRSQPTILNNVLWYAVAETETDYHFGFYSLLDKEPKVKNWLKVAKSDSGLPMDDNDLKTLVWFSDGYYFIKPSDDQGTYVYKDVRYAPVNPNDADSFLFSFKLYQLEGRWDMKNSGPDFEEEPTFQSLFGPMIERMKGI
ncbi:metal-dependent hydrolase [Winogradskyella maritima]|uniref:Metal-dependent hydrolase n=1 Tax=Winogradskyella maritima TaxID=1517766 RepID=A0ABV8AI84_9FLAO|nr:metal-dependent hydrolase [Winogradskyella maritima]